MMENDDRRDDVPDSWEEANDQVSKALENKIEEAKLKSKQKMLQEQLKSANDQLSGNCTVVPLTNSVDQNSLQSTTSGGAGARMPPIRILKRPESAGDLEKVGDGGRRNLAPQRNNTVAASVGGGVSTKSLEERATAYAQARERIFGVHDPVIHEDLPIQPKIIPRNKNGNSPVSIKPANDA